jgi:hypothetical protein
MLLKFILWLWGHSSFALTSPSLKALKQIKVHSVMCYVLIKMLNIRMKNHCSLSICTETRLYVG